MYRRNTGFFWIAGRAQVFFSLVILYVCMYVASRCYFVFPLWYTAAAVAAGSSYYNLSRSLSPSVCSAFRLFSLPPSCGRRSSELSFFFFKNVWVINVHASRERHTLAMTTMTVSARWDFRLSRGRAEVLCVRACCALDGVLVVSRFLAKKSKGLHSVSRAASDCFALAGDSPPLASLSSLSLSFSPFFSLTLFLSLSLILSLREPKRLCARERCKLVSSLRAAVAATCMCVYA